MVWLVLCIQLLERTLGDVQLDSLLPPICCPETFRIDPIPSPLSSCVVLSHTLSPTWAWFQTEAEELAPMALPVGRQPFCSVLWTPTYFLLSGHSSPVHCFTPSATSCLFLVSMTAQCLCCQNPAALGFTWSTKKGSGQLGRTTPDLTCFCFETGSWIVAALPQRARPGKL